MRKLKNRTAAVTGGGGCIGSEICRKLAEQGANIAVIDIRREVADATADSIRAAGGTAESFVADITDYAAVVKLMDSIAERFGSVDILVNVAGGSARAKCREFKDQEMEVMEDVLKMNVLSALCCTRAVVNRMVEAKWGKIIFIGSSVGIGGLPYCTEYAASKGAIFSLTRSLAMELGPHNINVNCVSPGIVPRPDEERSHGEAAERTAREKSWSTRIGKPSDIANMVVYLCSPEAEYIIGQNFVVDGGRTLGLKGN